MQFIDPTRETQSKLLALDHEGPVVMVNLLKFKPETGAASYAKYAAETTRFLKMVKGRLVYRGRYQMPFIGDGDWDEVLLVEYPSIKAFFKMVGDEGYQAIVHYRSEALLDSRLWVTCPE
jgi:uncharacterized protein (DUF1330 family)